MTDRHQQNSSHCKEYLQQISEYIDGELSPELCKKLEEHLAGCTNCTVVVNTLKRTIEVYQMEEQSRELPEGAKRRLYSKLSLDDLIK